MMRGIRVSIYRSPLGDSTNDGVTGEKRGAKSATLLAGPWCDSLRRGNYSEADITADDVVLVVAKQESGRLYCVPYAPPGSTGARHPMFGGNFVHTSDSRFPNEYPLPVHDRFE